MDGYEGPTTNIFPLSCEGIFDHAELGGIAACPAAARARQHNEGGARREPVFVVETTKTLNRVYTRPCEPSRGWGMVSRSSDTDQIEGLLIWTTQTCSRRAGTRALPRFASAAADCEDRSRRRGEVSR
jgi:hypothetical protein